jgi:DNA-binding transcriptional regulator WhiA
VNHGYSGPSFESLTEERQRAAAELVGIFAGDGTMYRTNSGVVIEVRGNPEEAPYYSKYVKPLFELTTGIPARSTNRTYVGGFVVGIRSCRKEAYSMLHGLFGFPFGDKCLVVKVPRPILENASLWVDYVRGIFDTDGSVYLRNGGRRTRRRSLALDISSSSTVHIFQLYAMVRSLGFNCWLESTHVRMGGWSTVNHFFRAVRPHNLIHIKRLAKFNAGGGSQAWHGEG